MTTRKRHVSNLKYLTRFMLLQSSMKPHRNYLILDRNAEKFTEEVNQLTTILMKEYSIQLLSIHARVTSKTAYLLTSHNHTIQRSNAILPWTIKTLLVLRKASTSAKRSNSADKIQEKPYLYLLISTTRVNHTYICSSLINTISNYYLNE